MQFITAGRGNGERSPQIVTKVVVNIERLSIRTLEPGDAEAMFAYRSDPSITRFQSWEPRSVEEIRTFIAALAEIGIDTPGRWYQLGLFIRESGELAGDCGIHAQAGDPRQVEVGITLASAFQGRGLAMEALKAVLDMRREAHFVESLWFKGAWADDVIYAMLRTEHVGNRGA